MLFSKPLVSLSWCIKVDVAGKFIASGGIVEEYLPHRRASLPRSRCIEEWDVGRVLATLMMSSAARRLA
ncbi:unnamed protein product [Victoria cruziana]